MKPKIYNFIVFFCISLAYHNQSCFELFLVMFVALFDAQPFISWIVCSVKKERRQDIQHDDIQDYDTEQNNTKHKIKITTLSIKDAEHNTEMPCCKTFYRNLIM